MEPSAGCLVPWTYNNPRVDRSQMKVVRLPIAGASIEIHQDTTVDIDLNKNTAYKIWDGSFLLARHLEDQKYFKRGYFADKRCIELGAGCGLVGLAAWLLGADVVVTDLAECLAHTKKCVDVNVRQLCTTAISQNDQTETRKSAAGGHCEKNGQLCVSSIRCDCHSPDSIKVMPYTWGADPSRLRPPFDIILASDIIYRPDLTNDVVQSLKLLSHANTVLLLSYKPRFLGEEIFFRALESEGYQCRVIPAGDHPKEFRSSSYDLLHILKATDG